ncbi:MAG: hypothetical protein DHS20C16_25260 [Phycisphaerae bacterium]|nr:MAG: hypothetical protein DHS20C16_25260 [Phycisphaerae bacterium]
MIAWIGRPSLTETVTCGGSNEACWTQEANIPVAESSLPAVMMLHPLGINARAFAIEPSESFEVIKVTSVGPWA